MNLYTASIKGDVETHQVFIVFADEDHCEPIKLEVIKNYRDMARGKFGLPKLSDETRFKWGDGSIGTWELALSILVYLFASHQEFLEHSTLISLYSRDIRIVNHAKFFRSDFVDVLSDMLPEKDFELPMSIVMSWLNRKIAESKMPRYTVEALKRYVEKHCRTGDFLQAVLENNLSQSFGRADEDNRVALFDICSYIYNYLPLDCHGSPEIVRAWLKKKENVKEKRHV